MKIFFLLFFFTLSAYAEVDPYWKKLLHYRRDKLGRMISQVDSKAFFVSEDGKRSPEKELEASIQVLNSKAGQEFVCKFPLRYKWLKGKVKNEWSYTTETCTIYNSFVGKLGAKNLSLVFSSFYVNNPGSTFGHTFLHIRRYDEFKSNELLDYAINFAATESKDNMLVYMFKGLAGFYPGKFSVVPYYYKIREYNDHEFRDIWDYDLALSPEQVSRVIDHVWELGDHYFDYFYFTENCSYHILGLLNVAYDDVDLLADLPSLYVLPIDTVKEVKKLGLIKGRKVRGSAYQKLLKDTEELSREDLEKVKRIALDPSLAEKLIPKEEKAEARLLNASISAMDYLKAEAILTNQPKETEERRVLLIKRAENPVIGKDYVFDEKTTPAPEESHGSSRFGLGGGYLKKAGAFSQLEWRAAQHELLDPSYGQLKFAQVTMFEWKFRHQETSYSDKNLVLEEFRLADLKKYQASDFWNKSISWDLGLGLDQRKDCLAHDCLNPAITFGVGNSAQFTDDLVLTFLLGGSYHYDQFYQNNSLFHLGPKANLLVLKDKFSVGLEASYFLPTEFSGGWYKRRIGYDVDFRYFVNKDFAFFVKSNQVEQEFRDIREGQMGIYIYH